MVRCFAALICAAAIGTTLTMQPSFADDHPTVGIVGAFSGPYAEWGQDFKREIDLYMAEHDGKDGNPKINMIMRDAPGTDYARSKQIVQGLITRDNAAVVGGSEFTPEALSVADLITEAKIPFVIFNAATSFVVDKSPYYVLAGFTIWQPDVPIASYAATHGCKNVTMIVADYAPGADTIKAFSYGFEKHGGKVGEVIKVPLGTTDFSAYMQRIRDSHPTCVFPFMPSGPMSLEFIKQYVDQGFKKQGIAIYDSSGATQENQLNPIGDDAIGIVSAADYSTYLDNPIIRHDFVTTDGYVAMALIYHMLKATNGVRDGDKMMAAIKGWTFDTPRGAITIDPKTRDPIQNIYLRRVVKENGVLFNKTISTIPAVHDQWHQLHPAS
jgi:branched-chain amino acid transport system substrate-binding protein